jgi:anti-sigma regulatory factor (Ser/Thr protein kinase)
MKAAPRQHGDANPPSLGLGARVEWSLEPGDTASVPELRHRIIRCLRQLAEPGSDLTDAEIVVGELLSNAMAHTAGPTWVSLRWDGVHPMLSVADVGPGFLRAPMHDGGGLPAPGDDRTLRAALPRDPLADGGRGLYLITTLAHDVAVAPRATGGSVMSVTLNLRRAPGATLRFGRSR